MDSQHPIERAFFAAVAVIAATFAFFVSPVLRFAPANSLQLAGLGVGVGAAGLWLAMNGDWGKRWQLLYGVPALASMVWMTTIVVGAGETSIANDARCLAIQRDMLSAHRRMADGPNVFQALGCRPQGNGMIRVAPTDRELEAGRPLSEGGYPNR